MSYVAFCLTLIVLIIPSFVPQEGCALYVTFPVYFHLYFGNTADNKFEDIHT